MNTKYFAPTLCLALLVLSHAAVADDRDNGVRHYLSLGTSLAVGIQPDANGVNQLTDEGYADQLHDIIAPNYRKLKLTKLGCPGETTATMIAGGKCEYEESSQLAQAVEFLHAHKSNVAVVTIDMGVNDVLAADCIDLVRNEVDDLCLMNAFNNLSNNLMTILYALRQEAHPDTKFVALNYYNTFLAFWPTGPSGEVLAVRSAGLAEILNVYTLGYIYGYFDIPVADVAAAFDSGNFGPSGVHGLPQNVLNICTYTWMCVAPPVGPNIHANRYGYGLIAATIAATLD
jgi:lysophospholipase L1-like esterase